MASDYRTPEQARTAEPKRSIFAGVKAKRTVSARALGIAAPEQQRDVRPRGLRVRLRALDPAAERSPIENAVERYARAQREVDAMHSKRSEEHTSELQSLMRISYAVFCLNKKKQPNNQ